MKITKREIYNFAKCANQQKLSIIAELPDAFYF